MQGAGNDFIIFDDRNSSFPLDNKNLIREITDRKKGIGSDGLILLQNSKYADIRMRFFNPDGTEVNMCGNGSRCISRLAILLKITNNNLTLETNIGIKAINLSSGETIFELNGKSLFNPASNKLELRFLSTRFLSLNF